MFGIFGVNPLSMIILEIAKAQFPDEELVYFDDDLEKGGKLYYGIRVVGNTAELERRIDAGSLSNLSISLGEKYLDKRKAMFRHFKSSVAMPVMKSEHAIISSLAKLDDGNILGAGVIVGHQARLSGNSIFWSGVVVEHDCIVGESCYIGPNATLSGFVEVGDCTMIGSGATILPEVVIGSNCIVGAGAVVINDVPGNSVVVGVPARIIRSCK
jgi:sugar O-acyltransferase (sialic acid O-acetyltransferase NeuD family)